MERIVEFLNNNKCVKAEKLENKLVLNNCWEDDSFSFEFSDDDEIELLNNFVLHKELFAIFHKDKNLYEFIFSPLPEELKRDFKYLFCNKEFHLFYGEPTKEFDCLAKHVVFNDSSFFNDRSFGFFRYYSFYNSEKEEGKTIYPTNFFIEGPFEECSFEYHISLFRHINFMMSYYDRSSASIIIFNSNEEKISDINIPCKSNNGPFPTQIKSDSLDTTLLDLMEAAKSTDSYRLKFIFYFQILEYCSYYYIENNLKRQIVNIIKSPDILDSEKYSNKIIEIYSDYFKSNKDEKRMERLLLDLCTYDDIKDELKTNSKYFIEDICFEGGYTVKKLFNREEEIDNPPQNIFISIRKNIDNIRNVLVHARESRENSEIKPTPKNGQLIKPYLYLLRRIAETVVIKYE